MKKRMISALLASAMVAAVALTGCGNNGGDTTSTNSSNEGGDGYRVAYVARTQSDSFAAWLANEMKSAAEAYDDITLDVFDGQADDEKENTIIENCITEGYDAVIIQPNNGDAQMPYAQKVVDAGKICITTNAAIDGVEGGSSVDADPYEQAKVNCVAALEQVPQNAKVVVLKGPSGNFHADQRREAWQKEFFDKRPDVKIVGEDIANWNKDEAMTLMENWVTANGKIDAIISMNDNMAAGALEAVKDNADFAGVLVYGVDGTPEGCLLIQEGKLTSTCLQSAIDLAKVNMETVHKLLTGEETEIHNNIEAPLVNKDNVDQYVEMYKERGLI